MSTAADVFAGATNERNPTAKFERVGDRHVGIIRRVGEYTGANDLKNNQMETSVTIDLETDAGTFVLWCRTHIDGQVAPNGLTRAIADAVRDGTGRPGLPEVGAQLAVVFDSEGQPSKPGLNPPKNYRAQYKPPAAMPSAQSGGPFDQPAATPAPVVDAPVAQPAPQPAATGTDLFA